MIKIKMTKRQALEALLEIHVADLILSAAVDLHEAHQSKADQSLGVEISKKYAKQAIEKVYAFTLEALDLPEGA